MNAGEQPAEQPSHDDSEPAFAYLDRWGQTCHEPHVEHAHAHDDREEHGYPRAKTQHGRLKPSSTPVSRRYEAIELHGRHSKRILGHRPWRPARSRWKVGSAAPSLLRRRPKRTPARKRHEVPVAFAHRAFINEFVKRGDGGPLREGWPAGSWRPSPRRGRPWPALRRGSPRAPRSSRPHPAGPAPA